MDQESRSDQKRRIPPYGPVKGMLEGLQLLQRLSPPLVDEALLRSNKVAPNNEYKVLGALRFLNVIDEDGKPTEKSRLLKTRGATYMLNLQEIVRSAYGDLFREISIRDATRDRIHNFFVTEAKMGSEMAVKATRFFVELCRSAGFELGGDLEKGRKPRSAVVRQAAAKPKRVAVLTEASPLQELGSLMPAAPTGLPIVLAITPEMARMGEEDLEDFFRRMLRAWKRATTAGAE